uniref:Uncharacterized protein n=1 Tax=Babesia bigemina TaxID=5866 RepID=Q9GSQ6_BABBI|nr:unknown [Babesia bigemina]
MLLTKVYFVALWFSIAQVVGASPGEDGEAAAASRADVQQSAVGARTLREEFIILRDFMEAWDIDLTQIQEPQVIAAKTDLESLAKKTVNELFTFIVNIYTHQEIFTEKTEQDARVPNYKGVDRYRFLKAIVYSMGKKFMALDAYLKKESTKKMADDIKRQMIKLSFAKRMEFRKITSLQRISKLVDDSYESEEAPIKKLLQLFVAVDAALKDLGTPDADPFASAYVESSGVGEELQEVDKVALAEAIERSYQLVPQQENLDALIIDLGPRETGDQATTGRTTTQSAVEEGTSGQLPQPAGSQGPRSDDAERGVPETPLPDRALILRHLL